MRIKKKNSSHRSLVTSGSWLKKAACRGNIELFFPKETPGLTQTENERLHEKECVALCRSCEVREKCLTDEISRVNNEKEQPSPAVIGGANRWQRSWLIAHPDIASQLAETGVDTWELGRWHEEVGPGLDGLQSGPEHADGVAEEFGVPITTWSNWRKQNGLGDTTDMLQPHSVVMRTYLQDAKEDDWIQSVDIVTAVIKTMSEEELATIKQNSRKTRGSKKGGSVRSAVDGLVSSVARSMERRSHLERHVGVNKRLYYRLTPQGRTTHAGRYAVPDEVSMSDTPIIPALTDDMGSLDESIHRQPSLRCGGITLQNKPCKNWVSATTEQEHGQYCPKHRS